MMPTRPLESAAQESFVMKKKSLPSPQQAAEMPHILPPPVGHSGALCVVDRPQVSPDELYPEGVNDLQMHAIELTIRGYRDSEIAESLLIDRKTLWRCKTQDAAYRRTLANTRAEVHANANDRYQPLLQRAVAVMEKMLDNPDPSKQFRAAHVILTMSNSFRLPQATGEPGESITVIQKVATGTAPVRGRTPKRRARKRLP
jgi:hypothetical protein